MVSQKYSSFAPVINFLIISTLVILEFTGSPILAIKGANPMLILTFTAMMCMFCSELTACLSGLITGFFLDSVSSGPAFFNTFFLSIACLLISLTVHYYFNNNIRAATALALICSVLYFLLKWLFGFAFSGDINNSLQYLLKNALPSAAYTALFVFPFYYLERAVFKKALG